MGRQVGGGRLAVGAAHGDAVALGDRQLVERVGEGAVGHTRRDRGDRFRIVGAHRVADHHEVRGEAPRPRL